MNTRVALAALAASFLLAGCGPEYTGSTYVPVEITRIDPPKRLRLDLMTPDGRVSRVYVSKRCRNWNNTLSVGLRFNARVNHFKTSRGETFAKFDRGYLHELFC